MTEDEQIELVVLRRDVQLLRRSERRNKYIIVFMAGAMVMQIYAAVDSIRTLRRTSDTMMTIADQRDDLAQENQKLGKALREQIANEDSEIRRGIWTNLPWFVSQLQDEDIAKLRALHKQQLQPPPVPQTH